LLTIVSLLLVGRHLADDDADEEVVVEDPTEEEVEGAVKADESAAQQQGNIMQQMSDLIKTDEMKEAVSKIRSDPELEEVLKKLDPEDPTAMLTLMQDPEFLAKLGKKVGNLPKEAMKAAGINSGPLAGGGGGQPAEPEGGWKCAKDKEHGARSIKCYNLVDTASIGDLEATEEFLAAGQDPNEAPEAGRTALHFAAAKGHSAIASALIKAKADLAFADDIGNTALHMAAGYGYPEVVTVLLDAGANPDAKDNNGRSPADVSKMNKKNKVRSDAALMARLGASPVNDEL